MRARACKRPLAEVEAEAGGGDVLELVGLVEHDHVVGRQDAARRRGGGVEVGVDHHHVGFGGPVAGRFGEADVARRALAGARAVAGGPR